MRRAALVRRTIALTAATALMSGGLAGGLFVTPASAAPAVVTKISPASWDNRSDVTLTLTGSNFPLMGTVILDPACSDDPALPIPEGAPCAPLTGAEVGDLEFDADPAAPIDTTLTASDVDLSMAPPGRYHVKVRNEVTGEVSSPFSYFRIFAYGGAASTSTAVGVGSSGTDPFGIECAVNQASGGGCGRSGTHPLDVKGSNFAIGAKVQFLTEPALAVDTGLTFTPGNPSNGFNTQGTANDTGYPSATVIQGGYETPLDANLAATFTPGWHKVRVLNTDGRASTTMSRFAQPYFNPTGSLSFPTAANPNPAPSTTIGQGAKEKVLRITGQGFRAGSTLYVERKPNANNGCADLSIGASTLGGYDAAKDLYTTIEAPLTFDDCDTPNNTPRTVGVVGPDGGRFFRSSLLLIGGFPTFTAFSEAQYRVMGQGAHEGFEGAPTEGVLVTGTNFIGFGKTNPAEMTSFDFGPGVTATTRYVGENGNAAFISIDIDPAAGTGERTVRATNPDGGSAVSDCDRDPATELCDPTGDGALLEITPGPKVAAIAIDPASPASSLSPGGGIVKYNVTGTGFQASGYGPTQFVVALPGQTTQDPKIDVTSVIRVSETQVNFQAEALTGAAAGPRDVIIENDDHGRFVCAGCIGIDSVSVSPTSDVNTEPTAPALRFTVLPSGKAPFSNSSTVTLSHTTPLTGQPDISGTSVTREDDTHGTAVFDLTNAARGRYNVTLVLDPANAAASTVSCIGCFTVTGAEADLDATTPVTPTAGGQGATNRKLTFKGTGFTKGMQVSIADVTVHDVTFVSPVEITALVDIAPNVTPEAKAGTVTDGAGHVEAFSFTVTAAPVITGVSQGAAWGAGAGSAGSPDLTATPPTPPTITVQGKEFVADPDTQIDLGPKIEVTGEVVTKDPNPLCGTLDNCVDSDTGNVAIDQTATLGKRAVAVVSADGGTTSLPDAFTVNPGPAISTIANETGQPVLLQDGQKHTIEVLGSAFPSPTTQEQKEAAFKITNEDGTPAGDITVDYTAIAFSPGKITVPVTTSATRAYGAVRVAIYNSADKGFFQCTTCLAVSDPPGPVANFKLTPLGGAIKATWGSAANNGSPITAYHLVRKDVATGATTAVDVSGSTLTVTFTGLTNGREYEIAINAINAAGPGPVVKARAVAGLKTILSVAWSKRFVQYGEGVNLSGRLTATDGAKTWSMVGKTITLTLTPAKGNTLIRTVKTSSSGTWSYPNIKLSYNWKVTFRYAGDATYAPISRGPLSIFVQSRVLKTFPASGSRSAASTTLKIVGNVAPNYSGKTVYLYRYSGGTKRVVATTTLSSTSTYVFSLKPSRGTYTYRVYIPAQYDLFKRQLNTAGISSAFTLYRT